MIKDLIARGIGFTPGSVKFIVTLGLSINASVQDYFTYYHEKRVIIHHKKKRNRT